MSELLRCDGCGREKYAGEQWHVFGLTLLCTTCWKTRKPMNEARRFIGEGYCCPSCDGGLP